LSIAQSLPFACEQSISQFPSVLQAKVEWLRTLDKLTCKRSQFLEPDNGHAGTYSHEDISHIETELQRLEAKKAQQATFIGIIFQECFFFWLRNYPPFVLSITNLRCSVQVTPPVLRSTQSNAISKKHIKNPAVDYHELRNVRKAAKKDKQRQKQHDRHLQESALQIRVHSSWQQLAPEDSSELLSEKAAAYSNPQEKSCSSATVGEFDVLLQVSH
jgi:hypothetical protein